MTQPNRVVYNIVGGARRSLEVITTQESNVGRELLGEVKQILADEHKVDPEVVVVRSINPYEYEEPEPYCLPDFYLDGVGEVPSPQQVGKMRKNELVKLAANLLEAFPKLEIDTDAGVDDLRAAVLVGLADAQKELTANREKVDREIAAGQRAALGGTPA